MKIFEVVMIENFLGGEVLKDFRLKGLIRYVKKKKFYILIYYSKV